MKRSDRKGSFGMICLLLLALSRFCFSSFFFAGDD